MTCPSCNQTTQEKIDRIQTDHKSYGEETFLVRCTNCKLYFTDPLPNEQQLSEIYSGVYHYRPNLVNDFLINLWSATELNSDIGLITKYKNSGTALDIGAGRGDMLVRLTSEKWERWAHDPFLSQSDIDQLKKKIGNNVNVHDNLSEYPENSFDLVILRNVIEHTAQFRDLVANIYRILKTGGVLFIRTPNINANDFKQLGTSWYVIRMAGHIVFFSTETLTNNLSQEGFKTQYCKPISYSAPTTLLKSATKPEPIIIKAAKSLLLSIKPMYSGEGSDLRAIARK